MWFITWHEKSGQTALRPPCPISPCRALLTCEARPWTSELPELGWHKAGSGRGARQGARIEAAEAGFLEVGTWVE